MFRTLKSKPFFVLLLPVFFVLHGLVENYGFIGIGDIGILAVTYLVSTSAIYLLTYLFFRNHLKAALLTSAAMGFNFFFGALFDFLKQHSPVPLFYKYSFLLTFMVFGLILLFFILKKAKRPFYRLTFFLNLLFIIYLVIDLVALMKHVAHPPVNKLAIYDFAKNNQYKIPDSCNKPDIYFIVFDEYASSRSIKQKFGIVTDIDSFLMANKFVVQQTSKSNYESTVLSIASMLNMRYLDHTKYANGIGHHELLDCSMMIRQNRVISYLAMNDYDIVNLSIFDLAGSPSHFKQSFLPLKTQMITEGTLTGRILRDFKWWFANHKLLKTFFWGQYENNMHLLQEIKTASTVKQKQPRFIYAHFFMPHSPFYVDRNGNKKSDTTIIHDESNPAAYFDYLLFVNTKIKKLIPALLHNTASNAVIMVMGDHGYRNDSTSSPRIFQNLNAVYFPPKYHSLLYDSITNVNQFPAIFNTLFQQNFPLQKDSSFYFFYKKGKS